MSLSLRVFLLLVPLVTALNLAVAAISADFAGLVDIGGDRKIYMECRGSGSPTVVLIAGGFEAGRIWTYALTPGDPVLTEPDDGFSAGRGNPKKLDSAVFSTVGTFTRAQHAGEIPFGIEL